MNKSNNTLDKIVTSFRIKPLHQVAALGIAMPIAIYSSYRAIDNFSQGNIEAGIGNTLIALVNISCFLLNEYIVVEGYLAIKEKKEYEKLNDTIKE